MAGSRRLRPPRSPPPASSRPCRSSGGRSCCGPPDTVKGEADLDEVNLPQFVLRKAFGDWTVDLGGGESFQDGEADKIKCVHLQSVIIFLLGVEVQVEVLDYYIVLLIPLGDLVK